MVVMGLLGEGSIQAYEVVVIFLAHSVLVALLLKVKLSKFISETRTGEYILLPDSHSKARYI